MSVGPKGGIRPNPSNPPGYVSDQAQAIMTKENNT